MTLHEKETTPVSSSKGRGPSKPGRELELASGLKVTSKRSRSSFLAIFLVFQYCLLEKNITLFRLSFFGSFFYGPNLHFLSRTTKSTQDKLTK